MFGLAAGVLMATAALQAPPALSQIAATGDFPLLAPTLDGNPRSPPVFRRTKPETAATPPAGQSPNFDYRGAIGAGTTGFNSSNTSRKARSGQPPGSDSAARAGGGASAPKPQSASPTALAPTPSASAIGDARLLQN
jgi:hypothetical protein